MKNIEDIKQAWLDGKLDELLSSGTNEDGENIIITSNNEGFYIITSQSNGWLRTDEYLYDPVDKTWAYSEIYGK